MHAGKEGQHQNSAHIPGEQTRTRAHKLALASGVYDDSSYAHGTDTTYCT